MKNSQAKSGDEGIISASQSAAMKNHSVRCDFAKRRRRFVEVSDVQLAAARDETLRSRLGVREKEREGDVWRNNKLVIGIR